MNCCTFDICFELSIVNALRFKALVKLLQLVRTDLDRERKSRIGLKGLTQTLNSQENQNVTDKLYHVSSHDRFV